MPAMSVRVFRCLSSFISDKCGIKLPPSKKIMLEGRLRKRLRALNMNSFDSYCDYLFKNRGAAGEIIHMIDVVTTNKTEFFRESSHFDFLMEKALPDLVRRYRKINIWSAGCSTGEEPYTLAMVLSQFAENRDLRFSIFATDISTRVLEKAKRAVYEHEKVEPVPMALRKRYLLRGKDDRKGLVRIKSELRSKIDFKRLNLMDHYFDMPVPLHTIFCRNVMIYFDQETQNELVRKFCGLLVRGGYLFTGHSETLHGMDLPLVSIAPNIHQRV